MAWRSPFQSTKNGGVPFPALTPWANSPGQLSDSASPMQTSPAHVLKSVIKKGKPATSSKTTSFSKASPMDAAPYTPLSARRGVVGPAGPAKDSDSKDRFVGKLSFTPHVSQHRHSHSAHKRSPDSSLGEPSASSSTLLILRHSMLSQLPLVSSWQHSKFLRLAQLMLAICSFPCAVYLATNPLPLLHSNDMYDVPFLQVHLHLNKQQHLQ